MLAPSHDDLVNVYQSPLSGRDSLARTSTTFRPDEIISKMSSNSGVTKGAIYSFRPISQDPELPIATIERDS